ncbi:MAG: UDP-N-acetylglucosamine 1-carboxyvinyltransferase [Candidatus Sungbacteria bacterium]|uniref:UDP-N-acetylglucosamine 1-carboxyvinyltransferase n=1 Tax=Candidatus Sungiibacteriota bacterium TaxID=2750080 RepID=A0A932QYI7_9BACT|nr:UDP-N-acetylglucosamine 1-carboxyvinyltransferase [Candidatus Sungbacteria bacterium]
MDKIRIRGGRPLRGVIPISGAKNAALPLMAASLLTKGKLTLSNVPYLADVVTMANLLVQHGVKLHMGEKPSMPEGFGRTLTLDASGVRNYTAPYDLVRTMRASVLVLGPLLARFGQAKVSLPGGCAIGTRPIDMHLRALEQMGTQIELGGGYINASVPGRLRGTDIAFDKVTVTGTENLLMAASLADGRTVLRNAAREPEVTDLARCLVAMGAIIEGIGTDTITIDGVQELDGAVHRVIADRIEAGTYAAAAAITGGDIVLKGMTLSIISAVAEKFAEAGIELRATENGVRVTRRNALNGVDIMTQPYPGFPTDMQAQMMGLLTVAEGASMITETIFENRFMHVPELTRMGARINVHGSSAMVRGVHELTAAEVMATDLRASVSLVIAGLAAKGSTVINRVYHLDRGYERLEEKLAACGAEIERVKDRV